MTMSSVLRGAVSDNVSGIAGAALRAVLPGANKVSEGGNSCVISSDATTKLASSSEPSQTVLCRRLI
jgi:hypothetical protein